MKINLPQNDNKQSQQRNALRFAQTAWRGFARLQARCISAVRSNRQAFQPDRQTSRPPGRQGRSHGSTLTPCGDLNRGHSYQLEQKTGRSHSRKQRSNICPRVLCRQLYSLRQWTLICLLGAILSACSEASAKKETQPPLTRETCLAIEKKDEKIACIKTLTAKRKEGITKSEKTIERLEKENETLFKEFEKGVIDN